MCVFTNVLRAEKDARRRTAAFAFLIKSTHSKRCDERVFGRRVRASNLELFAIFRNKKYHREKIHCDGICLGGGELLQVYHVPVGKSGDAYIVIIIIVIIAA